MNKLIHKSMRFFSLFGTGAYSYLHPATSHSSDPLSILPSPPNKEPYNLKVFNTSRPNSTTESPSLLNQSPFLPTFILVFSLMPVPVTRLLRAVVPCCLSRTPTSRQPSIPAKPSITVSPKCQEVLSRWTTLDRAVTIAPTACPMMWLMSSVW